MVIPISLVTQFIGMFAAVKILKINVNIIGIILLTFIPIGLSSVVPGLAGFGLSLLSLVLLVKIYDGSASFLKILAILVISVVTQAAINEYVVGPAITHSLNNAEKITIEDGRITIE